MPTVVNFASKDCLAVFGGLAAIYFNFFAAN